jgi:hypothetical protein
MSTGSGGAARALHRPTVHNSAGNYFPFFLLYFPLNPARGRTDPSYLVAEEINRSSIRELIPPTRNPRSNPGTCRSDGCLPVQKTGPTPRWVNKRLGKRFLKFELRAPEVYASCDLILRCVFSHWLVCSPQCPLHASNAHRISSSGPKLGNRSGERSIALRMDSKSPALL